jgi:mannose-1-phosphate guanylyltransferase/phosphomannomutase
MSIPPRELQRSLQQLAKICEVLQVALGVRLDVAGERVFVVDDKGNIIPGNVLCAAMAILALQAKPGGTVAVPVSAPNVLEIIAEQYGGKILRTKMTPQALMEAANRPDVILAADGNGSFIWPEFQPVVDGMMTVAKLLEFLAVQQVSLSQIVASVPPFYVAQGQVDCPWENKGTVMRLLNQQFRERLSEQIDGLKIKLGENEWVLLLPDPDEPVFHIHAQGSSLAQAQDLVSRYGRIIEGLQK